VAALFGSISLLIAGPQAGALRASVTSTNGTSLRPKTRSWAKWEAAHLLHYDGFSLKLVPFVRHTDAVGGEKEQRERDGRCVRPCLVGNAPWRNARQEGTAEFRTLQLITLDELHEIRRIWLYEKHEFDDSLSRIYEEVTGEKFPRRGDEGNGLRADDWELLREVCGGDRVFFDLQVSLLGVERQFRGMSRRPGIYEVLEDRLRTGLYGSEQEAVSVLGDRDKKKKQTRHPGLFRTELPIVDISTPEAGTGE